MQTFRTGQQAPLCISVSLQLPFRAGLPCYRPATMPTPHTISKDLCESWLISYPGIQKLIKYWAMHIKGTVNNSIWKKSWSCLAFVYWRCLCVWESCLGDGLTPIPQCREVAAGRAQCHRDRGSLSLGLGVYLSSPTAEWWLHTMRPVAAAAATLQAKDNGQRGGGCMSSREGEDFQCVTQVPLGGRAGWLGLKYIEDPRWRGFVGVFFRYFTAFKVHGNWSCLVELATGGCNWCPHTHTHTQTERDRVCLVSHFGVRLMLPQYRENSLLRGGPGANILDETFLCLPGGL